MNHQLALPGLATLALAVWLAGDGVAGALIFDRNEILSGEWWRLLTAHWVHLNGKHLVVSLATLFMIWAVFGKVLSNLQWLLSTIIITLSSSLTLLVFEPGVDWYLGLSGLLHGLLVVAALLALGTAPVLSAFVLVAIGVKLILETVFSTGTPTDLLIGGPVLVAAHLYGAGWGAFTAGGLWAWATLTPQSC